MDKSNKFNQQLHICLCNTKREELLRLTESPEFVAANMDVHLYVELIQLRWDSAVIMKFVQIADDEQLATLIATSILQAHVTQLSPLFALMKDVPAAIAQRQMKPLLRIACDHEDLDAVQALVLYKCMDPRDSRPLLTVVRKEAGRSVPRMELVQAVLLSHPGHTEAAQYALDNWVAESKYPEAQAKLQKALNAYIGA